MAQLLQTNFVTTSVPGAYANVQVVSNPSGLATTGVITIVGEADGGPSYLEDSLKTNFFTPAQADLVRKKYISGNVVDAMDALCAPSADANIQGAPTRIYIVKTNTGLQASAEVDTNYGELTDANYGLNGNNIKFQITASELETPPFVDSDTIPALATSDPTPQIQTMTMGKVGVTNAIAGGEFLELQAGNLGTLYYLWFKVDGVGVDPAPAGRTGILCSILSTDTWAQAATKVATAFNTAPFSTQFTAVASATGGGDALVTITNDVNGEAEAISNATTSPVSTTTVAVVQYGGLHDGSALNGASFSIRLNGGAVSAVTLSNNEQDHDSVAELVNELNGLLPSGMTASAGVAPATIILSVDADSANYRKGWGKAFELIDSTPGDLAALGLEENIYVSESESSVELNIVNQTQNANELLDASGAIGFEIGYVGTTATMTINATTLSTTVTGGAGSNLSIPLSQFATIADLASFINTKPGYSAAATTVGTQSAPSTLDQVSAIGIAASAANDRPGRVKQALYRFKQAAATSSLTTFTAQAVAGLPTPAAGFVFLAGGTKGGTANVDVLDGLVKAEGIQTNFVIPLFSQDASLDIAEGLTSSASTYTIAAINALAKTHELKMSTPLMKHYRQATCSYEGTYAAAKAQAQSLATYRCSLAFQKASQTDSNGNVTLFAPWYSACIAAGMQAAGFYKGITNKYGNIISFVDPAGFDSSNPGDLEDALLSGLLILQQDNAGNKWISDQTTYGFDNNFVYNSMQAVYLSDVATLGLINGVQTNFIGQSVADVGAGDVKTYVQTLMAQYKQLKIISASDDAPLGYKNLQVSIAGPVINISIELKLSSTIYFAAINISISQVEQTA